MKSDAEAIKRHFEHFRATAFNDFDPDGILRTYRLMVRDRHRLKRKLAHPINDRTGQLLKPDTVKRYRRDFHRIEGYRIAAILALLHLRAVGIIGPRRPMTLEEIADYIVNVNNSWLTDQICQWRKQPRRRHSAEVIPFPQKRA